MQYCVCKGTTTLQLLQCVVLWMLTDEQWRLDIAPWRALPWLFVVLLVILWSYRIFSLPLHRFYKSLCGCLIVWFLGSAPISKSIIQDSI